MSTENEDQELEQQEKPRATLSQQTDEAAMNPGGATTDKSKPDQKRAESQEQTGSQKQVLEEFQPFGMDLLEDDPESEYVPMEDLPRESLNENQPNQTRTQKINPSGKQESTEPLLSHEDLAEYLSVPAEVRKSKRFQEQLTDDIKLAPQKVYQSHKNFKDFLELPTIAKDLTKMPTTGYFPKETVQTSENRVFIADKINIKSKNGNNISVIIHRDHADDLKAIEVLTKDGDRVLISLETATTERDKVTEFYPDQQTNPENFSYDEIVGTNKQQEVGKEEFKDFTDTFVAEDYESLSEKLSSSDSISEDLSR